MPNRREFKSVQDYLDYVRQLMLSIPKAERDEALKEMAQHLQALVEAEETYGAPSDQAVRNAVARFGDPDRVASRYRREWLRRYRLNELSLAGTYLLYVPVFCCIFFGGIFSDVWFGSLLDRWYFGVLEGILLGIVQGSLFIIVPRYRPLPPVNGADMPLPQRIRMVVPAMLLSFMMNIQTMARNGHMVFVFSFYPSAIAAAYLSALATKDLLNRRQPPEPADSEPTHG